MRARLTTLFVMTAFLAGCGPNILMARGKVMNPLVKDSDEFAYIRVVTIVRKEPRMRSEHSIVGDYRPPLALGRLHEPAEIPNQITDGSGLLLTVEIFSTYKEELTDPKSYEFWLELPDGRRIRGRLHRVWKLVNLTEKLTGSHQQTHLVVSDRSSGTTKTYQHVEEVENDYELFWRKFRVVFTAQNLVTLDTPHLIFIVKGHQRERRYRFDFSTDTNDFLDEDEIQILEK